MIKNKKKEIIEKKETKLKNEADETPETQETKNGEQKEEKNIPDTPKQQEGQVVISKKENKTTEKKGISGFDMNDYTTTEKEIVRVTKKEIVTMDVRMPSKHFFFTIHPTWEFTANGFNWDGDNNIYIVHGEAIGHMFELTSKMKFYLGYDENDNHFLLPVTLPDSEGKQNPWHESREKIILKAKKGWIRCQSKKGAAGYDAYPVTQKYPDPEWTEKPKNELVGIAFADHQINSKDHPIIKSLKGERFK